jgi:hypothetical protein
MWVHSLVETMLWVLVSPLEALVVLGLVAALYQGALALMNQREREVSPLQNLREMVALVL